MARKASKMKEKIELSQVAAEIKKTTVKEFVNDNGLPYAYYTINNRALIGDDGTKPVNRRILHTMASDYNLKPTSKHLKAGSISGTVMGNYHPHGNSSIEDALSRLAQPFNMRVPLVDPQGSVGFVTGDKAAAVRYWEARLTPAGYELVREIKENAVPMVPNYSETGLEPVSLPIKWPVGIVNGTQGIAVGYSSNIPSHNPTEVMNAVIARMQGKITNTKSLMKYIKGPDFPTGGELIGLDGVQDYFETGKGTFVVRGKYDIETLSRGRHVITFYELPYQVSGENVLESIRKAQNKDQLKDISEAKDLSGMKTGLKVSIFVKAGANPDLVLEELWKLTPCQSKFPVNSTVLINNRPKEGSMFDLLDQFIEYRKICFERKTNFLISKLEKEAHDLEGILKILVNIDKAIKIIRNSKTDIEAKESLKKEFKVDEKQADYILQMRLRKLTQQDRTEIETKAKIINEELNRLNEILSDQTKFDSAIIDELQQTKKIIADERKTVITNISNEELAEQAKMAKKQEKLLSQDVECYVFELANKQIIKSLNETPLTRIPVIRKIKTTTQGTLDFLKTNGTIESFLVSGLPIDNPVEIASIGAKKDTFVGLIDRTNSFGTFIITNFGNVNIFKSNPNNKSGNFATLLPLEEIIYSKPITEEEKTEKDVVIISSEGQLTRFSLSLVRESGQGSGTVAGMKGSQAISGTLMNNNDDLVILTNKGIKISSSEEYPSKGRSTKGYKGIDLAKGETVKSIFAKNVEDNLVNLSTLKEIKDISYSLRTGKSTPISSPVAILS